MLIIMIITDRCMMRFEYFAIIHVNRSWRIRSGWPWINNPRHKGGGQLTESGRFYKEKILKELALLILSNVSFGIKNIQRLWQSVWLKNLFSCQFPPTSQDFPAFPTTATNKLERKPLDISNLHYKAAENTFTIFYVRKLTNGHNRLGVSLFGFETWPESWYETLWNVNFWLDNRTPMKRQQRGFIFWVEMLLKLIGNQLASAVQKA